MEKLLKVPSEEALTRWRRAATVVKNPRRRFRMVVDLARRHQVDIKRVAELKKLIPDDGTEDYNEIRPFTASSSPETLYFSCSEQSNDDTDNSSNSENDRLAAMAAKPSNAGNDNPQAVCREDSPKQELKIDCLSSMDVQRSNAGNHSLQAHFRGHSSKQEVLELSFAIANFIVELSSITFDQLSSQPKHQSIFLPICLGMACLAVIISIFELVYKVLKEKAVWSCEGMIPWFHRPSGDPVGSLTEVVGLFCALGQFILTTINYFWFLKHRNRNCCPIKISIWPGIFAAGQLCSKVWGHYRQKVHRGGSRVFHRMGNENYSPHEVCK